nr:hypothetical protein Iba_chr11bCG11910 [Ipomoea batatas]
MRAISSHVPDAIVVFSRTRCDRCLLTKAISCLEFGDQRSEGGDGIVIASRTSRTGLNSDRLLATTSQLPTQRRFYGDLRPRTMEQMVGGCCCSGVSVVDECCWWWMRSFYAGGLGTLGDPVMVPGGLRFGAGALHGLETLANAVVVPGVNNFDPILSVQRKNLKLQKRCKYREKERKVWDRKSKDYVMLSLGEDHIKASNNNNGSSRRALVSLSLETSAAAELFSINGDKGEHLPPSSSPLISNGSVRKNQPGHSPVSGGDRQSGR